MSTVEGRVSALLLTSRRRNQKATKKQKVAYLGEDEEGAGEVDGELTGEGEEEDELWKAEKVSSPGSQKER
jgi:hypothetical protein